MTRKPHRQESVLPAISSKRAIPLLRRQIDRAAEVVALQFNDPEVEVWLNSTINLLNQTFGEPGGEWHPNTRAFGHADSGMPQSVFDDAHRRQQHHVGRTKKRAALLSGFIEQLQDLAPPSAGGASDGHVFHPEIERVSGELYRDGHFKQAALEAYIRVIEQVKMLSGLSEDGDSLMNKVFGIEKQAPVIQVNSLSSNAERDEQRGFLYLFKGVVGLRNLKAHSNVLFDDPLRAHEYLALASLLMRILEIAHINREFAGAEPGS